MPHISVCACDGCPPMGVIPAHRKLGPLPSGTTLVRLPCPRAFEPVRVVELLLTGADGVVILVCAEEGGEWGAASDYEVEERLKVLRLVIRQVGLSPDRVAVEWIPVGEWRRAIDAVERLRSRLGTAQDATHRVRHTEVKL